MKKEQGKCENCKERDCEELFATEIEGKVKEICEDCQRGKIIEEEENGNK